MKIPPTLLSRLVGVKPSFVKALNITNLRPTSDGRFRAVGQPHCFASLKNLKPIGKVANHIIAASGTTIYSADADIPSLPSQKLDTTLPGDLKCVLERDADSILAMTNRGAALIEAKDQNIVCSRADSDYPPLTLIAAEANPISSTIHERILNNRYSTDDRISSKDASSLTSDLVAAYIDLCSKASVAGWLIQPALMRYKLFDKDGRELFSSAPVLLSHPSGLQCADAVKLFSDDRQSINAYYLSANTWRPIVRIPLVDDDCGVAMAKVFMSPLFHPYHPDRAIDVNIGRASDSDAPFALINLPGASAIRSSWRRIVMKAIARLDAIESPIITISDPFGAGQRNVEALIDVDIDVATVARSLSSALSKPIATKSLAQTLMHRPHQFSADCCAADAALVAWGGINVRRFEGYKPSIFATELNESSAWNIVAVVRFANGRGLAVSQSGSTDAPTAFSPVLTYPAPDAVSITITCRLAGSTYSATYPLTTDESGYFSVYIADDAKPITLPKSADSSIPSLSPPTDNFEGYLAFAKADAPLDIVNSTFLGNGAVTALLLRRTGDRSWEFGRSRFLAGSDEGLYSIGVAASAASISIRQIAVGRVSASDSLANGPDGIAFALCNRGSSAGPDLLKIEGSGSVTLFDSPRDYTSIVYNDVLGEFWAIRTDASADIFCRDYDWKRYSRTDAPVISGCIFRGEPFAVGAKGLLRLAAEATPDAVNVRITYSIVPNSLRYVKPTSLDAIFEVEQILGSISLKGCNIAGHDKWPIILADISGSCLSPIRIPIVSRLFRCLELDFDATVAGDFLFDSFNLNYND